MKGKGQASVEYLVILAVVLIIALVVVAALGGFIDIGRQAGPQASRTYWRTAEIGLLDWVMSSTANSSSVVVKNNLDYRINVSQINIGGSDASNLTAFQLAPGETETVSSQDWGVCTASGTSFSAEVIISYDNLEYDITGKSFTGASDIEGSCV